MMLSCGDALVDLLPVAAVDDRDALMSAVGGCCLNVAVGSGATFNKPSAKYRPLCRLMRTLAPTRCRRSIPRPIVLLTSEHRGSAMKNVIVYLVGPPGVGKYTVGKLIAERLSAKLLDNHFW